MTNGDTKLLHIHLYIIYIHIYVCSGFCSGWLLRVLSSLRPNGRKK